MKVPLVPIPWSHEALWQGRPNRFVGLAEIDGITERVHVRDPGRLKELLYPGNRVLVNWAGDRPDRKTRWDLVAAWAGDHWVLVNSGHHPAIARAIFQRSSISPFGRLASLRSEVPFGASRLDFLLEAAETDKIDRPEGVKILVEVKGCTLAVNSVALFPDAPTSRGRRHLEELMEARRQGYRTSVVILVFRRDAELFVPNSATDPDFARVFEEAVAVGVECRPLRIEFDPKASMTFYTGAIPWKA